MAADESMTGLSTDLNQAWFDERAALHSQSAFYDVQRVIDGEIRLNDYEIAEVGPVTGKDVIQLQCHIGLEAVSWARLGANASGLDFSSASIDEARIIAERSGVNVNYMVADIYDAPEVAGEEAYDVAYVNGGSLHWLPDIQRWGQSVSRLLRTNGMLYLNLFHPISMALDQDSPTFVHDYFSREPKVWNEPGSYVDQDAETEHNEHVVWEWPVCDIMQSVIDAGLTVTRFQERPDQEFQQFAYQQPRGGRHWANPPTMGVHPSTFSLRAIKATS